MPTPFNSARPSLAASRNRRPRHGLARLIFLGLALIGPQAGSASGDPSTALKDYLQRPDASYRWEQTRSGKLRGTRFAELLLVSQTWREIPWKHQLFVIKPRRLKDVNGHALLVIDGGRWRAEYEQPRNEADLPKRALLFARMAKLLRTPVAVLRQVPHQPMFGGLTEDRIIAHSFDRYLRSGDPEWPLLLPMTKSATKAMDAVQEFAAAEWALPLNSFTVVGGSKRGWTTWLVGAADPRVKAIAPVVIDMLKLESQMDHQRNVWGAVSEKISPYSDIDLPDRLATPGGRALQQIVDPFSYRAQLTQPKLIVLGTNDAYWPLDALNLYWNELVGPKYVLYVPNDGHSISDYRRLLGSVAALHRHTANAQSLPEVNWRFGEPDQRLVLEFSADVKPRRAYAWVAYAPSRDFRQANWSAQRLRRNSNGYRFEIERPREGYAAVFGEAVFGKWRKAYYLSSNVRIVDHNGSAFAGGAP